jgi:hypothetical protein
MSKRNRHSFNKRAKEIAKKKKADEKRARKLAKRQGDDSVADPEASVTDPEASEEPETQDQNLDQKEIDA